MPAVSSISATPIVRHNSVVSAKSATKLPQKSKLRGLAMTKGEFKEMVTGQKHVDVPSANRSKALHFPGDYNDPCYRRTCPVLATYL